MYKSFTVKNFRCFDELELTDLKRVNLIAGKNNVGKTALLEALFLHLGKYNLELTLRINIFRGMAGASVELGSLVETPWDSLFGAFANEKTLELTADDTRSGRRLVRIKLIREAEELAEITQTFTPRSNGFDGTSISSESSQVIGLEYQDADGKSGKYHMILDQKGVHTQSIPPPPFPATFLPARIRVPLTEDAERFSSLAKFRQEGQVLDALKIIEPRLKSLVTLSVGGTSIIHGDVGLNQLIMLPLMGDGVNRLAGMILAMGNAKKGVVLIDEIENGIHYSVLKDVWKAIGQAARDFDVQIFATTHSWECIVAAHQAFAESAEYDFKYHRLERDKADNIQVISFDQETMEASIDLNFEVR